MNFFLILSQALGAGAMLNLIFFWIKAGQNNNYKVTLLTNHYGEHHIELTIFILALILQTMVFLKWSLNEIKKEAEAKK